MSIIEFFSGVFNFPINEDMIKAATLQRGFDAEVDFLDEIAPSNRDLIIADILVMLSRSSLGYQQKTGSDAFTMTMQGSSISIENSRAMRAEANAIYRRNNENDKISNSASCINVYL